MTESYFNIPPILLFYTQESSNLLEFPWLFALLTLFTATLIFLDTSFKKSLLLKQHKILSYNSEYTEQFTQNETPRVVTEAHVTSYSHIEANLDT